MPHAPTPLDDRSASRPTAPVASGARLPRVWRLLIFLGGSLLCFVAAGLLTGTVSPLLPPDSPLLVLGFYVTFWAAAVTLWTAFCWQRLEGRPLPALGLVWSRRAVRRVLACAGAGALLVLAVAGVQVLAGALVLRPGEAPGPAVLLALPLWLAAFAEELLFRGYLLRGLLQPGRRAPALAVSSVLFALAHALNPHAWSSPVVMLNLLGAGLLLGLVALWSGDLWCPTAFHAAWNYAQAAFCGLPVSGLELPGFTRGTLSGQAPDWLTGAGFGLEGSLLTTASEVFAVGVFLLLLRARDRGVPRVDTPFSGTYHGR